MNNWKEEVKVAFENLEKVVSVDWLSSVLLSIKIGGGVVEVYLLDPFVQNSSADYEGVVIWKDQWVHKKEVVLARLNSMLNKNKSIFARKTTIVRPIKEEAIFFQEQHHLNPALPGKYRVGLAHEGKLVALAVFSAARTFDKNGLPFRSVELSRFCNYSGITVVGGLSKCLKYFIKQYQPDDIMTYVDMEWGDGISFKNIGFEEVGHSDPVKFYLNVKTVERINATFITIERGEEDLWVPFYNKGNRKLVWTLAK